MKQSCTSFSFIISKSLSILGGKLAIIISIFPFLKSSTKFLATLVFLDIFYGIFLDMEVILL